MNSFFDKLKKGMGIESFEESKEEELGEKSETPIPKEKEVKKIKIETASVEPEIEKNEELKKSEPTKKLEETKESEEKDVKVKKEKWFESKGQLIIDVFQTDQDLVIQSVIAGVKPENLEIFIENDTVIIKGERKNPFSEKEIKYFYKECYWGLFSREIILPVETDPSRAEATMKEGILVIRIPKIERKRKKKIEIKN